MKITQILVHKVNLPSLPAIAGHRACILGATKGIVEVQTDEGVWLG